MNCKGNLKRIPGALPCGVLITVCPRFWPTQGLGMMGRYRPAWRSTHPMGLTSSPDSGEIQDPHGGQGCGAAG